MEYLEIEENRTFRELGLDTFGQDPMQFFGEAENKIYQTFNKSGVAASNILSGDMVNDLTVRGSITVHDGTNSRVLIGYGKNLF